jgi:hypothetical protein
MAWAFQSGPRWPVTQHNLITDKDNNQIMFGNQNNCQNQISSIIMPDKDKPILEFDYFLRRKSEYILLFCLCQIIKSTC